MVRRTAGWQNGSLALLYLVDLGDGIGGTPSMGTAVEGASGNSGCHVFISVFCHSGSTGDCYCGFCPIGIGTIEPVPGMSVWGSLWCLIRPPSILGQILAQFYTTASLGSIVGGDWRSSDCRCLGASESVGEFGGSILLGW
jgi:hypothetical protein